MPESRRIWTPEMRAAQAERARRNLQSPESRAKAKATKEARGYDWCRTPEARLAQRAAWTGERRRAQASAARRTILAPEAMAKSRRTRRENPTPCPADKRVRLRAAWSDPAKRAAHGEMVAAGFTHDRRAGLSASRSETWCRVSAEHPDARPRPSKPASDTPWRRALKSVYDEAFESGEGKVPPSEMSRRAWARIDEWGIPRGEARPRRSGSNRGRPKAAPAPSDDETVERIRESYYEGSPEALRRVVSARRAP